MQERISLIFTDLDDYTLTSKQLLLVIEKLLHYYLEKDIAKFVHFVESFMIYFYSIYQLTQESKQGEKDEN